MDSSIQGRFITGHSVGGGAPFIIMKAAQRCFEAIKTRLPVYENTWLHLSQLTSGLDPGQFESAQIMTVKTINFKGGVTLKITIILIKY